MSSFCWFVYPIMSEQNSNIAVVVEKLPPGIKGQKIYIGLIVILSVLLAYEWWQDHIKPEPSLYIPLRNSAIEGGIRGAVIGGVLGGPAGAIANGMAFAVINPVMYRVFPK